MEAITIDGRYLWLPVTSLKLLAFRPPERARDLIWRRAQMELTDGKRGEVFVPALYPMPPGTVPSLRLGRETDWHAEPGSPVRGIGRKCLLLGEEDQDNMALGLVNFDRPAIAA